MAINSVPAAWQTNMQGPDSEDRAYIDFRQIDYPDVGSGSPTFSLGREDNLIDRGNCESTTKPALLGETAGAASNCTFARSADFAHGGEYSFKFIKTNAAGGASPYQALTDNVSAGDMHGFVAGEVVEFSAWVYVPTASGMLGMEVRTIIRDADTTPTNNDTTIFGVNTYDAWQKITGTHTISADAVTFYVLITTAPSATVNEYFYIDDLIVKRHSVPGSHYLSGGYSEHLVELADTGTIQIKFKPTFAFDTGSNQNLFAWYISATQVLYFTYAHVTDIFQLLWKDGGTLRGLNSAQYDDGRAHRNINQWITLTLAYDLTTGTTAGSSLWMNKTQDDTTWTGNIDVKSTTFNKMQLRALNGTAGAYDIAYMLYIPDYVATDADVQNDFKNVKDEQIFWPLDGHSVGRTRCNVSSFLTSMNTDKSTTAMLSGNFSANRADIELKSLDGEFADDQYAAFDASSSVYNGTSAQKYMQNRCRVMFENWYSGDFDYTLVGRVDDNYFRRRTVRDGISFVNLSIEDYAVEFAKHRVEDAQAWEAKTFTNATEANSLIHLIAREQSSKKVRNYCHNSGFENATIGNAWTNSGLTSMTRDTVEEYFGSACCEMVYDNVGGGQQWIYQSISFDNDEKLNVGDVWTFSCFLKSSSACSDVIMLRERDSVGANDDTSATYTISGGEGYTFWEVTHTITDSDSDELRVIIRLNDNVTIYGDGCMLVKDDRAPKYYVDNTAETLDADDSVEGEYDVIGFDLDTVSITHPWKILPEGARLWDVLSELAAATVPIYFGMTEAGTLKLRSTLLDLTTNTYSDPICIDEITDSDILQNIETSLAPKAANRIIVKGSSYKIYTYPLCLWLASTCGLWEQSYDSFLNEQVLNNGVFPDPDEFDELWAYYDRRYNDDWNPMGW